MPAQKFEYVAAFGRNLGWVTRDEQAALNGKRIAIAGLGGVGGVHLLTLVRLGVGRFTLADFDTFELANFNRQVGATMTSLGQPKLGVMAAMARDINPALAIETFDEGVTAENVDRFLDGVDLFLDGLDFFALREREFVFAACAKKGIPATTVAPLGMGAALLNFMPGAMSFDDYFGLAGRSDDEKAVRFLVGLAPSFLHRRYLADRSFVDLAAQRGPSMSIACQACAAVAAAEALKILLGRGKVRAAPHGVHFDAYRNALVRTWRPGGWRNPLQRAATSLAMRELLRKRA
ncbi:MAG TPA: ThiF family adenylyltransferase [Casimicrobiaceae bacterium]|nr:ThiF family adenylyltransferase [Casimicrobiaceae bacterium]